MQFKSPGSECGGVAIRPSRDFQCDFCGSHTYRSRGDLQEMLQISAQKHGVIQCARCRLVTLFPFPSSEHMAETYKDYHTKKNRLEAESVRRDRVYPGKLRRLKQYTRGNRLLDIGSGLGTFACMARESGFTVTGIDLSREQCDEAGKLYGIDLICGDILEVKESLGKFDVINMHHVVEHLQSPAAMFQALPELLTEGGVVLVEVPYQLGTLPDRLRSLTGTPTRSSWKGDHLFFFTPRTLRQYVHAGGLRVLEFNQHRPEPLIGHELLSPRSLFRFLFHRITTALWLPSGAFIEFYCRRATR